MGMFDEFVPSEKVICPKCNKELEGQGRVLQSKSLECVLDSYKQGKPLQIKTSISNFFIKNGWIEAHTICDKCDSYIRFKLIIENGVWTKVEKWEE